jgi:hypothetical protein
MAVSFNAKRLSSSWPSRRSDLGIRRKSFPETTLRANFFAETTLAPQESAKSLKAANFFTEYGYTPPHMQPSGCALNRVSASGARVG